MQILILAAFVAAGSPLAVTGTDGFMSAVPAGDGFLCMTWAGRSFELVAPGGARTVLFETSSSGFESISEPAWFDGSIAFTGRGRSGAEVVVMDDEGTRIDTYGPYDAASSPSWDSRGRLWYQADGRLYEDGAIALEAIGDYPVGISPSASRAAWPLDEQGLVSTNTCRMLPETVLVQGRCLVPEWAGERRMLVPTIEGMIWLVTGSEEFPLAAAESPSWSGGAGGFFAAVTRDDGMQVTSSEIVFFNLAGSWARVPAPRGSMPVRPVATPTGAVAVDASTGALLFLPFDRESAVLFKQSMEQP